MKKPKIRKTFYLDQGAAEVIKQIAEDLEISQNRAIEAAIRYAAENANIKDLAEAAGLWAYEPKEGQR